MLINFLKKVIHKIHILIHIEAHLLQIKSSIDDLRIDDLRSSHENLKASLESLNASIEQIRSNITQIEAANALCNRNIDNVYKDIIQKSIYWDPQWYNLTYGHNFSMQEALDYWYHIGWRKGENPSRFYNINYNKQNSPTNPLIEYIFRHFYSNPDNKNNFSNPDEEIIISKYISYKSTRKSKSCIYTAITNNYDDLEQIRTYFHVNPEWDYICYTDNEEYIKRKTIGIWEIRPLAFSSLDGTRNNRWHKLHPHLLFPEYEESIYIDSNINILSGKIFSIVDGTTKTLMLPKHWRDTCVYKEYDVVRGTNLDFPQIIDSELRLIEDAGMPKNYGLTENNVMYRRHNNPQIIKIMEEWWEMISTYSKRDQLSLPFILWKNHILIENVVFSNIRDMHEDFYIYDHPRHNSNQ